MRLVIEDVPVGMNGAKGLLRMGHFARTKYNRYWHQLVRAAIDNAHKPQRRKCAVFISQMRSRKLDCDNLAVSVKPILDALKAWKLIRDDSEKWIDLSVTQQIGKRKTTIIQIEEIPWKSQ